MQGLRSRLTGRHEDGGPREGARRAPKYADLHVAPSAEAEQAEVPAALAQALSAAQDPPASPEGPTMSYQLNPPLPGRNANAVDDADAVHGKNGRRNGKSSSGALTPEELAQALEDDLGNGNGQALVAPVVLSNGKRPDPEACLGWLAALSKTINPGALHMLLQYYQRLGWIPNGAYGYMRELCTGIARQIPNLTWESLAMPPERLIQVHVESYKWLSQMFPGGGASVKDAVVRRGKKDDE
jgi:hypothetical protein